VRHDDLELVLAKPTTFMNDSGVAVRKILARERAPLEDLLVVVDDFALPLGRLRLRESGSAGSHNGLRSIIGELGTEGFARLRVGIGEPSRAARDHVLSRFSPAERERLDGVVAAAAESVEDWAREGVSRAATRWNPWMPDWAKEEPETDDRDDGDEGGDWAPAKDGQAPVTDDEALAAEGRVAEPEAVGADGIVRTRRGWRKLLAPGSSTAERESQ